MSVSLCVTFCGTFACAQSHIMQRKLLDFSREKKWKKFFEFFCFNFEIFEIWKKYFVLLFYCSMGHTHMTWDLENFQENFFFWFFFSNLIIFLIHNHDLDSWSWYGFVMMLWIHDHDSWYLEKKIKKRGKKNLTFFKNRIFLKSFVLLFA